MMQALCANSVVAKGATAQRQTSRASPVVCHARHNLAQKTAAAAAALPALIATHPAFALVDERLNGDGTGKALGIGSPLEAVALISVFGLIWTLFQSSGKALDKKIRGEGEDSGMSL